MRRSFDGPRETDRPPVEFYSSGETSRVLHLTPKVVRGLVGGGLLLAQHLRRPEPTSPFANGREGGDWRLSKEYVHTAANYMTRTSHRNAYAPSNPYSLMTLALESKDDVEDTIDRCIDGLRDASKRGLITTESAGRLLGVERHTLTRNPTLPKTDKGIPVNALIEQIEWRHLLIDRPSDDRE